MPGKSITAVHGPHPSAHSVAPSSSPAKPAAFKARDWSTSASTTVKSLLGAFATATNVTAIKKHEDHDAGQLLVEKRLFASRNAKRLDLSTTSSASNSHHASAAFPITFQLFPRQVVLHEQMGHHLTELWLTNHHIAALPPEIGQFSSLRVLGLGGNVLSSLPEELGQLKNLETLYLEKNRFKTIPIAATNANSPFPFQLRDLRLDNNSLTVFPIAITKLRLLNKLGLGYNQIREIPQEIRRLRNLVELDLDFNCVGPELPSGEMQLLTKLERLGLDGNFLTSDALEWTKRMPKLTYLRINGNRAVTSSQCSNKEEGVTGPDESFHENQSVPVRHDGYFQCTQSYRRDGKRVADPAATTAGDDNEGSHGGIHQALLLEGLVPCREQNLLNAELYRAGLAGSILHRKT